LCLARSLSSPLLVCWGTGCLSRVDRRATLKARKSIEFMHAAAAAGWAASIDKSARAAACCPLPSASRPRRPHVGCASQHRRLLEPLTKSQTHTHRKASTATRSERQGAAASNQQLNDKGRGHAIKGACTWTCSLAQCQGKAMPAGRRRIRSRVVSSHQPTRTHQPPHSVRRPLIPLSLRIMYTRISMPGSRRPRGGTSPREQEHRCVHVCCCCSRAPGLAGWLAGCT